MEEESRCVDHIPCPACGSKDNLALYDDGHAWCFTPGCGYRISKHNSQDDKVEFVDGVCEELRKRKIRSETVEKWSYETGTNGIGSITQSHVSTSLTFCYLTRSMLK